MTRPPTLSHSHTLKIKAQLTFLYIRDPLVHTESSSILYDIFCNGGHRTVRTEHGVQPQQVDDHRMWIVRDILRDPGYCDRDWRLKRRVDMRRVSDKANTMGACNILTCACTCAPSMRGRNAYVCMKGVLACRCHDRQRGLRGAWPHPTLLNTVKVMCVLGWHSVSSIDSTGETAPKQRCSTRDSACE